MALIIGALLFGLSLVAFFYFARRHFLAVKAELRAALNEVRGIKLSAKEFKEHSDRLEVLADSFSEALARAYTLIITLQNLKQDTGPTAAVPSVETPKRRRAKRAEESAPSTKEPL